MDLFGENVVSRDEEYQEAERLKAAKVEDPWGVVRRWRCDTKDQAETYRRIAEAGLVTFRYRCGGSHGPLHKVTVERNGKITFPDHPRDVDTTVTDVLTAIAGSKSGPTCDEIRKALSAPNSRASALKQLWPGTTSEMPGWAQALHHALESARSRKEAEKPWVKGIVREAELALKNRALLEISQDGSTLRELGACGVEWSHDRVATPSVNAELEVDFRHYDPMSRNYLLQLPWPEGYLAYLSCGLMAEHGDHRDLIPVVYSVPGTPAFSTPSELMALVVCHAGGEGNGRRDEAGKIMHGRLLPGLLVRSRGRWVFGKERVFFGGAQFAEVEA
jgi:hypothetical protein